MLCDASLSCMMSRSQTIMWKALAAQGVTRTCAFRLLLKWLENKGSETRLENVNNLLEEIDCKTINTHNNRGVKRQDCAAVVCRRVSGTFYGAQQRLWLHRSLLSLRSSGHICADWTQQTRLFTSGTGRNNEVSSFIKEKPPTMTDVSTKRIGKVEFTEGRLKTP